MLQHELHHAEAHAKAEEASRQLAAGRQQLACAFGDPEALASLTSMDEVESLELVCHTGLGRLMERRIALRQEEERARQASR